MVMLVENQPMPSAGTMPRDRHGTYHVSMTTPPPAVAAQPFSHQWDINDSTLPLPEKFDKFQAWPHGHCRYIYNPQQEDGRRHVSGWAMRNTNNHNALILKKSCLGVLVCSQDCLLENGEKVHLRPAICDKARRKQIGKPCPNPKCSGSLELMACRGHCGYPVTHFWRHAHGAIYFQAKGYHDHPRPEVKSVAESRRGMTGARHYKSFTVSDVFGTDRKRQRDSEPEDAAGRKLFAALPGDEVLCSCPPFECTCNKSRPGYKSLLPPYDMLKDSLPPPPSFTQINITNNYPPPTGGPSLDLFLRGSNTGVPPRQGYGMMDNPRLLGPAVSVGQGAASGSPVNARAAAGGEASAFDVPSCRQRIPTHPDSSMCAATLGHGAGLGDGRPRAATPLAHRPEFPPGRFLCEQQGSESEPLLLGDRLLSGGSTSHFLSPSTEALFGGPSRMEELCTVPPGVKTEPQDTHSAFRPDSRPLAATDSSASTSAMGDPAMDISRHLTPPAGCAGETMFSGGSGGGGGGVGGPGPSSLPHLLASRSPDSVLDAPDSDAAFTAMTSPMHGHAQVATPTLQDKRFEELRPVQHKLFPGQQGPRTAFDVLHNPVFFRDDMHHPGLSSSSASTLSSLSRPRENTLAGNFFGQQEAIAAPHAPMPMRSDAPVTQHPGVSEVGSPWYGRCPSDCFQRPPQGSQPYPGMYKQACNHSINITLTYN